MEQISSIVSKENYADHWQAGVYRCARCSRPLYESSAKFVGPCLWPSFRAAIGSSDSDNESGALHTIEVPRGAYNHYTCLVHELYCGSDSCRLFLGHSFEDGVACGDTHKDARWRHCVLSLSLEFVARDA